MKDPAPIVALLDEALADGTFPSAQAEIRAPGLKVSLCAGTTELPRFGDGQPVDAHTRYDIASLTKALSTSVLLMQAVEAGLVQLDWPVRSLLPAYPLRHTTVAQLASHRAGLPAHAPFYEPIWAEGVTDPEEARGRMAALITQTVVEEPRYDGELYSDIGYILLGWLVERALGDPLNEAFHQRIAQPLGLDRTGYGPIAGPVAATELDREGLPLRGVVHDENARVLGGVAGHAGLFSTACEVAALVEHLSQVHAGMAGIVAPETVRQFWTPRAGGSFTLGWDRPSPQGSSAGSHFLPEQTVGHLGFTGCSVWHDHRRQVTVVLLTNRVHPTRENVRIKAFRPRFHDAIHGWLD